ncbi:MAG: D-aminoacyl-tRNA deacylase, partial [Candidatus Thermoplasmatota archaeon]|nr:D-aminoacyl-tRNA deacylase [Candidatus Thermoplasmatota archaeon]
MMSEPVVLIVVSGSDIASTNQADELLLMHDWFELDNVEGSRCYAFKNVRMWWLEGGVLKEDHLDARWEKSTGEIVSEIIFPSRHYASSGKASLTIHPIGTPHVMIEEDLIYGGQVNYSPPPNPRIAAWFNLLCELSEGNESVDGFDISLEVTHHGPVVNCPSLFIETGSTAETWPHKGAAKVLAEVISKGLGLNKEEEIGNWSESKNQGEFVMIT